MTYPNLPKVLTPEEVADYFKIDKGVVLRELEEGRLRGFKVGPEWRCTDGSLIDYVNRNHTVSAAKLDTTGLEYKASDFVEVGPFDYQWPKDKEHFENGYETTRNIGGRTPTFKVGFTNRPAAGRVRRRAVVWMDNWPMVEFAGGDNYESDGLLAGIVKVEAGKQLRPSGKIPEGYGGFRIARYDSVVRGPYASRNMAIIVSKDDLESMVRHAVLRAQLKGLI